MGRRGGDRREVACIFSGACILGLRPRAALGFYIVEYCASNRPHKATGDWTVEPGEWFEWESPVGVLHIPIGPP
jgi:hypothetical protein